MTITINQNILYYWIFSIAFQTVYFYIQYRISIKKIKAMEHYQMFKGIYDTMMKERAAFQLFVKNAFNPFTYCLYYILFSVIAPFILPFSILSIIKTVIGYKTKLEKRAAEEEKMFEEAKKRSEEFMRNEGVDFNTGTDSKATAVIIEEPE